MAFTFSPVPNKFVPKVGQTYRFIGVPVGNHPNLSFQIGRRVWNNYQSDKARLAVNNVFETIGEAKAARTKLVAVLKDAQKKAPAARYW